MGIENTEEARLAILLFSKKKDTIGQLYRSPELLPTQVIGFAELLTKKSVELIDKLGEERCRKCISWHYLSGSSFTKMIRMPLLDEIDFPEPDEISNFLDNLIAQIRQTIEQARSDQVAAARRHA